MLKAIENAVRERKFLNAIGRFAVDGAGCGRAKRWWQATLPRRTRHAISGKLQRPCAGLLNP